MEYTGCTTKFKIMDSDPLGCSEGHKLSMCNTRFHQASQEDFCRNPAELEDEPLLELAMD